MSPQDENAPGPEKSPAARPNENRQVLSGGKPARSRRPPEPKREFKSFDASRSPTATSLKDPSMAGRLKRSKDRRQQRKRRRRFQRLVLIPCAIGLVLLVPLGMTLRNFYRQDRDGKPEPKSGAKAAAAAAPVAAAPEPEQEAPVKSSPRPAPVTASPNDSVQEARDRYLMRSGPTNGDGDGKISEQSKEILRAAGLSSEKVKEGEAKEEITEEEKERLLRKAAPYSRTVRETQSNRKVEPEDLYLPATDKAK